MNFGHVEGAAFAEPNAALRQAQGSVTLAARQPGIGRATLYRRLKRRQASAQ